MSTNNAQVDKFLTSVFMERGTIAAKVAGLESELQVAKDQKKQAVISSLQARIKLWSSTLEWIDFHESKNKGG